MAADFSAICRCLSSHMADARDRPQGLLCPDQASCSYHTNQFTRYMWQLSTYACMSSSWAPCVPFNRLLFPCLDADTSPCRPVLSFDASFDEQPHLQLLKEMLGQVFSTPSRHHKAKPFFDHIFSFSVADGCIWMRNYQVGVGLPGEGMGTEGQNILRTQVSSCLEHGGLTVLH